MTNVPTMPIVSGPFYELLALPSAAERSRHPETKLSERRGGNQSTTFKQSGVGPASTILGSATHPGSDRIYGDPNKRTFTLSPAVQDLLQQLLSVFHSFAGRLIGGNVAYNCETELNKHPKLDGQLN